MNQITLGELLRRHRLSAELTQKQLAYLIGYNHTWVSRIERNKERPTEEYIQKFIETLCLFEESSQEIWALHGQDSKVQATAKQRVQIYLQGEFSVFTPSRRVAVIDALAGLLNISPQSIEVYSVHEGSVVFELGVPLDATLNLLSALDSNDTKLHLLEVKKVIMKNESGEIEEWNIKSGKFTTVQDVDRQYLSDTPNFLSKTWKYNTKSGVVSVAISTSGEMVVAGTLDKIVLALDKTGRQHWQAKVGNQAWRVAINADGQTTVVGTGSSRPWDMSGRGLFCFANNGSLRWQVELDESVWGLALSADGNTIAVSTSGKKLIIFDGQGNRLWSQKAPSFGPYVWVWSTALSADGQVVVLGTTDKYVRLFERSGVILAEHQAQGDVFTVSVSADGEAVAAGDGVGYIYWLNRQGRLLWKEKLADKVWATVLSADGTRLLVGTGEKDAHLRTYDQSGRLLWRRYMGGGVSNLALSANGKRAVAGTRNGGIYIFAEDGDILHHSQANKAVRDLAISAKSEQIVAGSEDGHIYVFQSASSSTTKLESLADH